MLPVGTARGMTTSVSYLLYVVGMALAIVSLSIGTFLMRAMKIVLMNVRCPKGMDVAVLRPVCLVVHKKGSTRVLSRVEPFYRVGVR